MYFQYLDHGVSLFRRPQWQVEDELIRQHLSLSSHPALSGLTADFVATFAETEKANQADVRKDLTDEVSPWKI